MDLSLEWHDAMVEQSVQNWRIRLRAEAEGEIGLAAIAEEEELHCDLILECYNVMVCQFVDGLNQDACVASVLSAAQAVVEYNKKWRK